MTTKLGEILEKHWGKLLGVVLALLFGLLTITYGFWKALFLAVLVTLGYFVGKHFDDQTDWRKLWDRLFGDSNR